MKKTLLTLLGMLISLQGFTRDFTYTHEGQTLTYTVIDEDAKTCKTKDGQQTSPGNNITGTLIIPTTVNDSSTDFTVTEIGKYGFSNCKELTSLTIPNTLTSIGEDAFVGCEGLTGVYIDDLKNWCNISFDNINANPLAFAGKLYLNNNEITDLQIPDSVTSIKFAAFYKGSGFKSVTIPNSVTSIGQNAFCGCTGLTSVNIPVSVKSIGRFAFAACSNLSSVTIPNGFSLKDISKSNIFQFTPYNETLLSEIKKKEEERKLKEEEEKLSAILGSWTLNIGGRDIAVYTFKKDNTYTAKYTNYLSYTTGCSWTFTETGTWELYKDRITLEPKTFTSPIVKVTSVANIQQRKYPSIIAQMTASEKKQFLKEHISQSANRHIFKVTSNTKMEIKSDWATSEYDTTWGYLIKSAPSKSTQSTVSSKKRSTAKKRR